MKTNLGLALTVATVAVAWASAAFATEFPPSVGGPAPLLGAGLPGLAVLAAAGGGYLAMRLRGRK